MDVLIHNYQQLERWREGVMTRMRMSALLGGRQLCIFDQFCDPGLGAPIHSHAVEEVLEVIEGTADRRGRIVLAMPRRHDVACACHVSGSDLRSVLDIDDYLRTDPFSLAHALERIRQAIHYEEL